MALQCAHTGGFLLLVEGVRGPKMESIKPAIKSLKDFSTEATIELEKFKTSTNIPELCRLYKEIKESLEVVEELVKTVTAVKEELSTRVLADLFESSQLDSIKTANRSFTYKGELHASMKPGKEDQCKEWIRSKGYSPIIKEGVHPSTLSTCMREFVDKTGEMPPDDLFNTFIKKSVSIRKVR